MNASINATFPLNLTDLDTAFDNETWSTCSEWTDVQHNLFQMANFFFSAAFLIPPTFKQSVLLVRFLLVIGFVLVTFWGGMDVCAYDIFLWNLILAAVNAGFTIQLTMRFLPPVLNLELTELYLKVFKPLKASKKHFKEVAKEGQIVVLEKGDIYAVEGISPADEKLSLLLKGKLRVTCEDTHLHFIHQHQFIDSPEWEANHEKNDDVFQVTITAEEDCQYISWPRMKLERVFRHRPHFKVIFDSIVGKDITQKLYAVNEHLLSADAETQRKKNRESTNMMMRSLSLDAVHTGTKGHVRSDIWRRHMRRPSISKKLDRSPFRQNVRYWEPIVATQFPPSFPFPKQRLLNASATPPQFLAPPPLIPALPTIPQTPIKGKSPYVSPNLDLTASTEDLLPPVVVPTITGNLEKKLTFRNSFRRHKDGKGTQVKFSQVKEK